MKINCNYWFFIIFFSFPVRMSWNLADIRKQFVKLESKLGRYLVVLTAPKNFSRKTYTQCRWKATIARHWKHWLQKGNVLPKMDFISRLKKNNRKLQDCCRQSQKRCVPLMKQGICFRHCPHTFSQDIHGPDWVHNRWRHESPSAAVLSFYFNLQSCRH